MEKVNDVISNIMVIYHRCPWYTNILMIFGFVLTLLAVFCSLVLFIQVAKTAFAVNLGMIGYIIFDCISNSKITAGAVGVVILLIFTLLLLLFIIYCSDDNYCDTVLGTFFSSLADGLVNIGIIFVMCTVVLIPLGLIAFNREDRYS